jgi:hypothetical protein
VPGEDQKEDVPNGRRQVEVVFLPYHFFVVDVRHVRASGIRRLRGGGGLRPAALQRRLAATVVVVAGDGRLEKIP